MMENFLEGVLPGVSLTNPNQRCVARVRREQRKEGGSSNVWGLEGATLCRRSGFLASARTLQGQQR